MADCLARWAEGIPKVFIVLFVLKTLRASPLQFGWLTSIQQLTAILVYVPIGRLSDRLNRRPFILATFLFFSLFPLMLARANGGLGLILAFLTAGLREFGEPARKAMIVDLAPENARARTIGLYYLIRGLVVFPASLVGGWLWSIDERVMFDVAGVFGIVGCCSFVLSGTRHIKGPGLVTTGTPLGGEIK